LSSELAERCAALAAMKGRYVRAAMRQINTQLQWFFSSNKLVSQY